MKRPLSTPSPEVLRDMYTVSPHSLVALMAHYAVKGHIQTIRNFIDSRAIQDHADGHPDFGAPLPLREHGNALKGLAALSTTPHAAEVPALLKTLANGRQQALNEALGRLCAERKIEDARCLVKAGAELLAPLADSTLRLTIKTGIDRVETIVQLTAAGVLASKQDDAYLIAKFFGVEKLDYLPLGGIVVSGSGDSALNPLSQPGQKLSVASIAAESRAIHFAAQAGEDAEIAMKFLSQFDLGSFRVKRGLALACDRLLDNSINDRSATVAAMRAVLWVFAAHAEFKPDDFCVGGICGRNILNEMAHNSLLPSDHLEAVVKSLSEHRHLVDQKPTYCSSGRKESPLTEFVRNQCSTGIIAMTKHGFDLHAHDDSAFQLAERKYPEMLALMQSLDAQRAIDASVTSSSNLRPLLQ